MKGASKIKVEQKTIGANRTIKIVQEAQTTQEIVKETKKLKNKETFMPLKAGKLTRKQKDDALESITTVTRKKTWKNQRKNMCRWEEAKTICLKSRSIIANNIVGRAYDHYTNHHPQG